MHSKLVLSIGLTLLAASLAAQERDNSRPLVTVYGTSEMKVVPDVVDVSIGVEIRGKDLGSSIDQQRSRVTAAIGAIRKAGVDSKDVQTSSISITPVYTENDSGRILAYFRIEKEMAFTLRDTAKFDALMAALIQAGVNQVQSVQFRATEIRKYRDQARAMAVVAARDKAAALAAKLDRKLGKAFSIDEDEPTYAPSMLNGTAFATRAGGAESSDSSLLLGQVSIEARVKVSFELQ